MSHFCTHCSNTSILTHVYIPYSAQVPEMVTSFRSVTEIITGVPHYKFSAVSILVLIFNPTDFTEAWRSLILACTSHCRLDSKKMSSERLNFWYSLLFNSLVQLSLHTINYQVKIMQCLQLFLQLLQITLYKHL